MAFHSRISRWVGTSLPCPLADIPYNLGVNAYASSTEWYIDGDNKKGESDKAGKQFFNTDSNFNIAEYMHFCSKLLKKEPKEKGQAPAMIVFCAFEQMHIVIEYGKKYGFNNSYPLFFIKNYSSQVLKSNMKIVGATEHAVVLYRDKLPKFNNNGRMIFNWMEWERDNSVPKIHPNQKPIPLLKKLINIFTDEGDVVIDPVAGSGILTGEALFRKMTATLAELGTKKMLVELAVENIVKATKIGTAISTLGNLKSSSSTAKKTTGTNVSTKEIGRASCRERVSSPV